MDPGYDKANNIIIVAGFYVNPDGNGWTTVWMMFGFQIWYTTIFWFHDNRVWSYSDYVRIINIKHDYMD